VREGWLDRPIGGTISLPQSDDYTLTDVMRRLDEVYLGLGERLDNLAADLKRALAIIYQRISPESRDTLEKILVAIQQQRFVQTELQSTLNAVRRTLKHIQVAGLPIADHEIQQTLADIYQAVNSNQDFQQQLELSIPIIPLLLEYKIGLDAGVDLGAVWKELIERIRKD